MLGYYRENEEIAFVSEERQHNVCYNSDLITERKYSMNESFREEDNKNIQTIRQPFCRIIRH